LTTILDAVNFTNKIIFGRTNYNKEITAYANHRAFYNEQTALVIAYCNEHGIQYHIKYGTTTKMFEVDCVNLRGSAKQKKAEQLKLSGVDIEIILENVF